MIELSYHQLVTTPIAPVMQKLNQLSVFDAKTAYRIHKINEKLRDVYVKSSLEYEAMGREFSKVDPDGNPLKSDKGHHIPEEGKEQAYQEKLETFLSTKFQINQLKLNVHTLAARFSPQEIAAIEPLLDGLSDEVSLEAV